MLGYEVAPLFISILFFSLSFARLVFRVLRSQEKKGKKLLRCL